MRNYPINFVVKHPTASSFLRAARPEAVRNLFNPTRRSDRVCFHLDTRTCSDAQVETVNENLVELNGIEPLTPCLQSRCSPN